jgi:hypothetical protein
MFFLFSPEPQILRVSGGAFGPPSDWKQVQGERETSLSDQACVGRAVQQLLLSRPLYIPGDKDSGVG